jgi:acyl-CoA reductase-like NAD-dependent aldehyde dehydrogenase
MKTLTNFINGKSVPSTSGKTQDLINPAQMSMPL